MEKNLCCSLPQKRRGTGNSAHLLRLFLLPPKCHFRFVCNHQHRSSDSQKVHSSSFFLHTPFLHVVTRVRGHGTGGRKVVGGWRHGRDPAGRVVVSHPRAGEHERRLRLWKGERIGRETEKSSREDKQSCSRCRCERAATHLGISWLWLVEGTEPTSSGYPERQRQSSCVFFVLLRWLIKAN